MKQKKLVTIDFDMMKEKAAAAAKALGTKAKSKKDQAMASLFEKGIALSQKQLKALEATKKRFI